ncbi:MAG TPA: hypothetical protein VMB47_09200 [Candidatus Aquilonibacter sp.]|nr:hypothetical protein [Candidatus Aquilonibacter sp.]
MANAERNSSNHGCNGGTIAMAGAALLIALGVALQWIELLFARFVADNSWFFATLFGETWNMINVWLSAAAWHQDLQYWPMLFVITGAAILFSRTPRQAMVRSEARTGARQDA